MEEGGGAGPCPAWVHAQQACSLLVPCQTGTRARVPSRQASAPAGCSGSGQQAGGALVGQCPRPGGLRLWPSSRVAPIPVATWVTRVLSTAWVPLTSETLCFMCLERDLVPQGDKRGWAAQGPDLRGQEPAEGPEPPLIATGRSGMSQGRPLRRRVRPAEGCRWTSRGAGGASRGRGTHKSQTRDTGD